MLYAVMLFAISYTLLALNTKQETRYRKHETGLFSVARKRVNCHAVPIPMVPIVPMFTGSGKSPFVVITRIDSSSLLVWNQDLYHNINLMRSRIKPGMISKFIFNSGLSKKGLKIKEAARRWNENLFETDRKRGWVIFIRGGGFRSIFLYFFRKPRPFS